MSILAVSIDPQEPTAEFVADGGPGFPIAADVDGSTIRRWGLSEAGEDRSVPATFVIDQRGVIRFAQIGESIGDRVDIEELLAVLDGF